MSAAEVERLFTLLVMSGHLSALEHASFTFGIDGISRACSHQLVRHRLASYSQQSQRYVHFSEDSGFIIPPKIAEDAEALGVFEEAMGQALAAYDKLVELGTARGLAKETVQEDARFVLPNAAETRLVVTMNARELRHFFQVRCCRRAQWEINELAWAMRHLVTAVAPTLFEKTGPGCVIDSCPEGKMACGTEYSEVEIQEMDFSSVVARPVTPSTQVARERS